jgi:hypothetical protein
VTTRSLRGQSKRDAGQQDRREIADDEARGGIAERDAERAGHQAPSSIR